MIAISGIMEVNSGQIVLAGDPKQLGPILRSPYAIKYGLGMSTFKYLKSSTEILLGKEEIKLPGDAINDKILVVFLQLGS